MASSYRSSSVDTTSDKPRMMVNNPSRLQNDIGKLQKPLEPKDIVRNKRILYDGDGRRKVLKRNKSIDSVASSQMSHTNTNNSVSSYQQKSKLKHDPNLNFEQLIGKQMLPKERAFDSDMVDFDDAVQKKGFQPGAFGIEFGQEKMNSANFDGSDSNSRQGKNARSSSCSANKMNLKSEKLKLKKDLMSRDMRNHSNTPTKRTEEKSSKNS